ncbi:NAD-dependent epimerase/dehydratase family protein [Shouchella clausii]|uniref:NAD-dependent epimerase/dehydratase family protein n=1 Tax=Shouchella clausii TaxID=79880 RepID=UPI00398388AD
MQRKNRRRLAHDYEKILVEQTILNDERLPGTILWLPMVYGPNDPQRRLFDYIQRMKDGRPYILMDERMARWKASMGYVENVAAAIAMSINHAETASHVLNVGEKTAMSMLDRVTEIGKVMKWDGKVISVHKGIMDTELLLETKQDLVVDTSKIREHFGYIEPISDEEGLRRTVQWDANAPKESSFDYRQEDDMIQLERNLPTDCFKVVNEVSIAILHIFV